LGTDKLDLGVFTDGKNVQILLTPQSGDYYENEQHQVSFELDFEASEVTVQRIDDTHCNPKRLWQEMGEPDNLTRVQVEKIKAASRLSEEPFPFETINGKTQLKISLRTNDVYLITVKAKQ